MPAEPPRSLPSADTQTPAASPGDFSSGAVSEETLLAHPEPCVHPARAAAGPYQPQPSLPRQAQHARHQRQHSKRATPHVITIPPGSRARTEEPKQDWSDEDQTPSNSSHSFGADIEKRSYDMSHGSRRSRSSGVITGVLFDDREDIEHARDHAASSAAEEHTLRVLLFLSGPAVLLSFFNALWLFLALLITALSQPLRLCWSGCTFSQQLSGLLAPTLNLQLRGIYAAITPPPTATAANVYNTPMLAVVHLLSPFVSFAVMFASWTLAVYWLSSAIVGDPAGQDKRDDGKETVLALRNWWERWLMRSFN